MKKDKLKKLRSQYIYSEIEEHLVSDFLIDLSNDVVLEYSGKLEFEIEGLKYSEFIKNFDENYIHYKDSADFINFFDKNRILNRFAGADGSEKKFKLEFRYKAPEAIFVWRLATLQCFKSNGTIYAYVYVEDIDSQKKKIVELIYRAEHDPLTKLKNKSAIEAAVNKFLVTQGSEGLHALFCFDIDNFKNINNSFGHVFGDVFLVETANAVKRLFRKDDLIGRIGGDEFVIFMKEIENRYIAFRRASDILNSVRTVFAEHGEAFNTTISIGISFFDGGGKNYGELFKEADTAMYFCKNSGKNKYAEYNSEMDSNSLTRLGVNVEGIMSFEPEQNASEYIFRVLRDNTDKDKAFKLALELICNYFDINNVSIFDFEEGKCLYSHSSKNMDGSEQKLLLMPETLKEYLSGFSDGVLFYGKNPYNKPAFEKYFIDADIFSAIHFTMLYKGKIRGTICFNRYNNGCKFMAKDISILRNIANLLYCRIFY